MNHDWAKGQGAAASPSRAHAGRLLSQPTHAFRAMRRSGAPALRGRYPSSSMAYWTTCLQDQWRPAELEPKSHPPNSRETSRAPQVPRVDPCAVTRRRVGHPHRDPGTCRARVAPPGRDQGELLQETRSAPLQLKAEAHPRVTARCGLLCRHSHESESRARAPEHDLRRIARHSIGSHTGSQQERHLERSPCARRPKSGALIRSRQPWSDHGDSDPAGGPPPGEHRTLPRASERGPRP